MISTGSILFAAVLVFSLMFVGIALTAFEFKKMENASAEVRKEQEEFTRRHSVRLANVNEDVIQQAHNDKNSNVTAMRR